VLDLSVAVMEAPVFTASEGARKSVTLWPWYHTAGVPLSTNAARGATVKLIAGTEEKEDAAAPLSARMIVSVPAEEPAVYSNICACAPAEPDQFSTAGLSAPPRLGDSEIVRFSCAGGARAGVAVQTVLCAEYTIPGEPGQTTLSRLCATTLKESSAIANAGASVPDSVYEILAGPAADPAVKVKLRGAALPDPHVSVAPAVMAPPVALMVTTSPEATGTLGVRITVKAELAHTLPAADGEPEFAMGLRGVSDSAKGQPGTAS
jgi:hypothetical protein